MTHIIKKIYLPCEGSKKIPYSQTSNCKGFAFLYQNEVLYLDFYFNTARQFKLHQSVNSLSC